MSSVFCHVRVGEIDLSSFGTSNVRDLTDIFKNAGIIVGYARNQEEANQFNQLLGKKVFIVKQY